MEPKGKRGRGRPPSPFAEHRRVAGELRDLLAAETWRTGDVLPSLRQLADRFGSTLSAVRRSVELLRREQRVGLNGRGRLVPLRKGDPGMDGRGLVLLVSGDGLGGPWSGYRAPLTTGLLQGAGAIGAPVLIAHGASLRSTMPDAFLDYPLRGVILMGHFRPAVLRAYEKLPLPVVIADTPAGDHKIHSVCVDNGAMIKDAVLRLAEMGHRRIAFMRFILFSLRDVDPDSGERYAGFVEGCKEAGLPFSRDWVFNVLPTMRPIRGDAFRRLTGPRSKFTAIITGHPEEVVRVARQFKLSVPRDLSVVAVNAKGVPSAFSGPTVDFADLGARVAPLLNQPKLPPLRVRVPAVWQECGSVQKPRD